MIARAVLREIMTSRSKFMRSIRLTFKRFFLILTNLLTTVMSLLVGKCNGK